MHRFFWTAILSGWVIVGCAGPQPSETQVAEKAMAPSVSPIERGKYLVDHVADCGGCHSPRDQQGNFVESEWLQGAALMFQPIVPMPGWADTAQGLAGLPTLSEEEAVHLLETGKYSNGQAAGPPMPQYRFSHEDALAAVAYLKSLKSS